MAAEPEPSNPQAPPQQPGGPWRGSALPVAAGQQPPEVVGETGRAALVAGERVSALATVHRHVIGARDTITEVQDEVARAARAIKTLEWSQERLQAGSTWPDRIVVNEQLDELARRCERSTAPVIVENLRRAVGALDAADVLTRDPGLHRPLHDGGDRREMLARIEAARELIDWAVPVLDRAVERLHHTAVLARYAQEHRRDGAGPVRAMGQILRDVTTDGALLQRTVTDLSTRSADAAAHAHTLGRAEPTRRSPSHDVGPPPSGKSASGRGMPR